MGWKSTYNKLRFNNSFQFLSFSLDDLVQKLANDFKYLSQKFDIKVLYLVKAKKDFI